MTDLAPVPADRKPAADTFWTTYSPNGEAPVSWLSSTALHGLILAAIVLGAALLATFQPSPPEVTLTPVAYGPRGGSGEPTGEDTKNPGPGQNPDVVEPLDPSLGPVAPKLPTNDEPIPQGPPPAVFPSDDPTKPAQEVPNVAPTLRAKLAGKPGKGISGPGGGGGDGSGIGKDKGPGKGIGIPPNKRIERQLRWTVLFATTGADDYLRQLHALGAILVVPESDGQFRVFRDLRKRPLVGVVEDIRKIDRISWADDNPASVTSLAQVMSLPRVPAEVRAFFPESLEKRLLAAELEYGRPLGRTTETDIGETVFRVSFPGGRVRIDVVEQKAR